MTHPAQCKEIAVLVKARPATRFLEDFFCARREYRASFFNAPRPFIKSLNESRPAAVMAETPFLQKILGHIQGIPAIAVVTGGNPAAGIGTAINCRVSDYVCEPFVLQDVEYKLQSALGNKTGRFGTSEVEDLRAIIDVTKWVAATLDPKELLYRIVTKISQMMPVTRCSIIRVDWLKSSARVVSSFQDPDIVALDLNLKKYPEITEALRTKKPVFIRDVVTDPLMKRVRDIIAPLGIRSILVVPLLLKEEVIGTLFIRTSRAGHAFRAREVELLKTLADISAVALHNAILYERMEDEKVRLEKLAITDFLTGIYNVRYFYHRIIEEFSRSQRHSLPLSCLMVDIDFFKKINDAYGHKTGDMVLKEFAMKLKRHSRKSDVVARYGGEEFIILLPQTTRKGAVAEAERVRLCVKKCRFRSLGRKLGLTVSIGIATHPDANIETHDDLISLADDALFEAKRLGRDRVAVSGSRKSGGKG